MSYDRQGIKGYITNPQNCPLCGMTHDIHVQGFTRQNENMVRRHQDKGYSFCNCRNILFTDWKNIDQSCYDEEYSDKYDCDKSRGYIKQYAQYFKFLDGNIKSFMDIGSINDALLDEAKKEGWKTYGVDINPTVEQNNHERITGNIEDQKTLDKMPKVDVIWASHIFEHFKDPIKVAENLRVKLNKGGYLFVAMPDPWFIDWTKPEGWCHFNLEEHHIFWDMDSFIDMMLELGYELVLAKRNSFGRFICIQDYHLIFKI